MSSVYRWLHLLDVSCVPSYDIYMTSMGTTGNIFWWWNTIWPSMILYFFGAGGGCLFAQHYIWPWSILGTGLTGDWGHHIFIYLTEHDVTVSHDFCMLSIFFGTGAYPAYPGHTRVWVRAGANSTGLSLILYWYSCLEQYPNSGYFGNRYINHHQRIYHIWLNYPWHGSANLKSSLATTTMMYRR